MLETSKDLLFLVLALCALLFTVFSCVLLYYFISIIKNIKDIIGGVKQKLDAVDEVIQSVKAKVNNTASFITLGMKAFEKITDYVGKKQTTKTTSGRKKKSAEEV